MSTAEETAPEGRLRIARFLPRTNVTGSLYGLVLVSSVLVTLGGKDLEWAAIAVVVTAGVFALAHAWAHALGEAAKARAPVDRHAFRHSLRHELPILAAAAPAALALLVAGAGVYSVNTGLWVGLSVNVVLLFVWGAGLRELSGGSASQILGAGMSSAALGLVLVALKVFVH
jgi:hypothetical protein